MALRSEDYKEALKKTLKSRGRTYRELASHMGVSLPTVKRWLGAEEIAMGRLLEILDWLDLSLAELESLAQIEIRREVGVLTLEQEKFFVQNPGCLAYLSALHSGESPGMIAEKNGLNEASTELYLLRLERQGFLSRDSRGRVRLLHRALPGNNAKGPLLRRQYKQYIEASGDFFKRQVSKMIENLDRGREKSTHPGWMSIEAMKVSASAYREWQRRAVEIIKEIHRRAELERRLEPSADTVNVAVSFFCASTDLGDPDIEILTSPLGRIENIAPAPR